MAEFLKTAFWPILATAVLSWFGVWLSRVSNRSRELSEETGEFQDRLQKHIDQLEKRNADADARYTRLEQRCSDYETRYAQLEQRYTQVVTERDQLQVRVSELEMTVARLQRQVQTMQRGPLERTRMGDE